MTLTAPSPATTTATGFPPDFVWGAATASYQIEGAVDEDGRSPSIWDTFSATPGRVRGGDTGETAVDHYHRVEQDVALMGELGLGAYRFSLAWPRIKPAGSGPVNAAGVAFYDRLVDRLLEQGITPWVTLYHWDLPQVLEDRGGWPRRETAYLFAEYAEAAGEALGNRVKHWTTLNEPWCSAYLGYSSGRHAPGRQEPGAAVAANHHLLLGHGHAVDALRAVVPDAEVGITLNLYPVTPLDDRAGSLDAARRVDGLQNRMFLDPVLKGSYPADVLDDVSPWTDTSWLHAGDLEVVSRPLDFLGVNYYTRHVAGAGAFPGAVGAALVEPTGLRTANNWAVDADGLVEVLRRVHEDYTDLPLYVTENGSAWHDHVEVDGAVRDPERTAYLAAHLDACLAARDAGVPLQGYFAWSLMDNFEWAEGYAVRFGLVHVDYETQVRTVKSSGRWYADFIDSHARAHADGILAP